MAKGFEKGKSGNPNGRKKGVQNKVTVKAKEAFLTVMELLEKRMTDGDDVINSLHPARAAELYVNLLNYIKPKLSSNRNENATEHSGGITIKVEYEKDNETKEDDDSSQ